MSDFQFWAEYAGLIIVLLALTVLSFPEVGPLGMGIPLVSREVC